VPPGNLSRLEREDSDDNDISPRDIAGSLAFLLHSTVSPGAKRRSEVQDHANEQARSLSVRQSGAVDVAAPHFIGCAARVETVRVFRASAAVQRRSASERLIYVRWAARRKKSGSVWVWRRPEFIVSSGDERLELWRFCKPPERATPRKIAGNWGRFGGAALRSCVLSCPSLGVSGRHGGSQTSAIGS
jgi:hypothetical protein